MLKNAVIAVLALTSFILIVALVYSLTPERWDLDLYGLHKDEVRKVLGWPDRPESEFKGGDVWSSCRMGLCIGMIVFYDGNGKFQEEKRSYTFRLKRSSEVMYPQDTR